MSKENEPKENTPQEKKIVQFYQKVKHFLNALNFNRKKLSLNRKICPSFNFPQNYSSFFAQGNVIGKKEKGNIREKKEIQKEYKIKNKNKKIKIKLKI